MKINSPQNTFSLVQIYSVQLKVYIRDLFLKIYIFSGIKLAEAEFHKWAGKVRKYWEME